MGENIKRERACILLVGDHVRIPDDQGPYEWGIVQRIGLDVEHPNYETVTIERPYMTDGQPASEVYNVPRHSDRLYDVVFRWALVDSPERYYRGTMATASYREEIMAARKEDV